MSLSSPYTQPDEDEFLDLFTPLMVLTEGNLPLFRFLDPEDLNEPTQTLLMTDACLSLVLKHYLEQDVTLKVHQQELGDSCVLRAASLHLTSSPLTPSRSPDIACSHVASFIQLENFNDYEKTIFAEGKTPLGLILEQRHVPCQLEHRGCFEMKVDPRLRSLFTIPPSIQVVYGRCTQLIDQDGIVFADLVEFLTFSHGYQEIQTLPTIGL